MSDLDRETVETMAQCRGVSAEDLDKAICTDANCDQEQCIDYAELLAMKQKQSALVPTETPIPVDAPTRYLVLPTDAATRNEYPMFDGLFGYFPNALAAIARLSLIANEQHNPGEPLHWAIGKSKDHANKIVKHLLDHGHMDTDGTRHSTKLGWRSLALLEEELVAAGAPRGRNAY